MHIIPAFDIMDGRLVRLRQGDFDTKVFYPQDPLELAKELEASGIKRLHMVDLDGARDGRPVNLYVLEQIAARTRLSIDYGGGLRSIPALRQVWDAGADMFSVGSVAVKAPDEFRAWVERFGADRFLVGADVRDRKIAVHGWLEQTTLGISDFIQQISALGITQVSVTNIAHDGEMRGPDLELYRDMLKKFPDLLLVASGGISSVADLEALQDIGCEGAIVGKAFFEGEVPLHYFRVFSKI
ncbi:MAG: 1-(5-phosphoribosyl)-5-[(5-phosphoribosylamino)methylideneamino] imidazole-4-carboxamide isomerase [Lewinellaceae bacterium]|nr:1-(5-phosphoribosyl)-5-[(5-phosphoribosylamino)methylideneamino] imidazole-4-carboxamide isomerase [Lewinellaceae bacterium]